MILIVRLNGVEITFNEKDEETPWSINNHEFLNSNGSETNKISLSNKQFETLARIIDPALEFSFDHLTSKEE